MKTIRAFLVTAAAALTPLPLAAQCNWTPASTSLYEICGFVGIGTTAPTASLQLNDGNQTNVRLLLSGNEYFQPGNGTATNGIALLLGVNRTSNKQLWIADSETLGTTGPTPTVLRLHVGGGNAVIDAIGTDAAQRQLRLGNLGGVAISPNGGNVGIGTATPSYKLHVNGDARVEGTLTGVNIQAKYQDVAEWVPSSAALEPGTVVVLNPARSNEVMAAAEAYDTRVAGVVSAQPGISLGEPGPSRAQVATTGRVKVRVDATRAPIAIGDLLVTGHSLGRAMRSEPVVLAGRKFHQPGTVLGKALEPLAAGEGEILVLLSLQ